MSRINVSWATVQPVLATQYFWKGSVVAGENPGFGDLEVALGEGLSVVREETAIHVRGREVQTLVCAVGRNRNCCE